MKSLRALKTMVGVYGRVEKDTVIEVDDKLADKLLETTVGFEEVKFPSAAIVVTDEYMNKQETYENKMVVPENKGKPGRKAKV